MRDIPYALPHEVFRQAREHYFDNSTGHFVAVQKINFKGKIREMVLTYDKKNELVEIVTIHPIKPYQKFSRIKTGRWKKI